MNWLIGRAWEQVRAITESAMNGEIFLAGFKQRMALLKV
jgi:phosphoserine phosphatase